LGAGNRRRVLGGLVAAGLVGADVAAAGPCGDGSAKQNRCKRHRQCCTGYCHRKKRKRKGRCECRKLNQPCRDDQSCCDSVGQPMRCVSGTCQQLSTTPPPETCVPLGSACAADGPACCTDVGADAACTEGVCRAPAYCAATLAAQGCVQGLGTTWQCQEKELPGVNLSGCILISADLSRANLTNARMVSTDLTNAFFQDTKVANVTWGNTLCPKGAVNSDDNGGTCCGAFLIGQTPSDCPPG
ncbi:MAG: pentapeptide repeat-containing protein, partial [Thermomicrobiales bacterium]|nr:pentapeptide repeat-containing protein [Thermomicrobiales bacterium]